MRLLRFLYVKHRLRGVVIRIVLHFVRTRNLDVVRHLMVDPVSNRNTDVQNVGHVDWHDIVVQAVRATHTDAEALRDRDEDGHQGGAIAVFARAPHIALLAGEVAADELLLRPLNGLHLLDCEVDAHIKIIITVSLKSRATRDKVSDLRLPRLGVIRQQLSSVDAKLKLLLGSPNMRMMQCRYNLRGPGALLDTNPRSNR